MNLDSESIGSLSTAKDYSNTTSEETSLCDIVCLYQGSVYFPDRIIFSQYVIDAFDSLINRFSAWFPEVDPGAELPDYLLDSDQLSGGHRLGSNHAYEGFRAVSSHESNCILYDDQKLRQKQTSQASPSHIAKKHDQVDRLTAIEKEDDRRNDEVTYIPAPPDKDRISSANSDARSTRLRPGRQYSYIKDES